VAVQAVDNVLDIVASGHAVEVPWLAHRLDVLRVTVDGLHRVILNLVLAKIEELFNLRLAFGAVNRLLG